MFESHNPVALPPSYGPTTVVHNSLRARRAALAVCAAGLTWLAYVQPAFAQRLAAPPTFGAVSDARGDAADSTASLAPVRAPQLAVQTDAAPAPLPAPTSAPQLAPAADALLAAAAAPGFDRRPYTDSSPWNTRIGSSPTVQARSAAGVSLIGGPITSDPNMYTYPVYFVDRSTPKVNVTLSGMYSNVTGSGSADTTLTRTNRGVVQIPARSEFSPASGGDSQIIIVDPSTGDEWGFWRLKKSSAGRWTATSGYHYNVYWDGHPPRDSGGSPFGSRGAGLTYFGGLIRPWEIRSGRIDHALAFAFGGNSWPSVNAVFPAAKSDGNSSNPNSLPEGARLQLDPRMTEAQLRAAGCSPAAIIMARAMQEYGMYVVDQSGSDKILLEYSGTADWSSLGIGRSTASCIPLNRLRRVG
jgi:hypothetical protein